MTNFETESYSKTIEYILKNHHTPLKKELPELEKLVYTIFKVHFEDMGDVLEKVHKLYGQLKTTLESHIIKEERALFYSIRDYDKDKSKDSLEEILEGIKSVEMDNKEIEELVKEIRKVTDNYLIPPTSCPTYENTYNRLKDLEKSLCEHIDIENTLFLRLKDER
jgi:regulator of cell morphogenesis and NO signaling